MSASEKLNVHFKNSVTNGKMNSRFEDSVRSAVGLAFMVLCAITMAVSQAAREAYGPCSSALGAGLVLWRTGQQSL